NLLTALDKHALDISIAQRRENAAKVAAAKLGFYNVDSFRPQTVDLFRIPRVREDHRWYVAGGHHKLRGAADLQPVVEHDTTQWPQPRSSAAIRQRWVVDRGGVSAYQDRIGVVPQLMNARKRYTARQRRRHARPKRDAAVERHGELQMDKGPSIFL